MMRRLLPLALGLLLLSVLGVRAGMYIPGEPSEFVPNGGKARALALDQFRLRLQDAVAAHSRANPTKLRRDLLARIAELESRRARLSSMELVALGGYHYRIGDNELAFAAWLEASRKDPRNFLAYSGLALLKLATGELLEARRYQEDARVPK